MMSLLFNTSVSVLQIKVILFHNHSEIESLQILPAVLIIHFIVKDGGRLIFFLVLHSVQKHTLHLVFSCHTPFDLFNLEQVLNFSLIFMRLAFLKVQAIYFLEHLSFSFCDFVMTRLKLHSFGRNIIVVM